MRRQRRLLEYFPKMWDFILPQTGLLRSMLGPSDLGPGGRSYNKPISCLQRFSSYRENLEIRSTILDLRGGGLLFFSVLAFRTACYVLYNNLHCSFGF